MTQFKLQFSGEIKKVHQLELSGKPAFEVQLMKKNYAAQGTEQTWTWVKVMIKDPKEFQVGWLREGGYITGSGEFSMRSYVNKDGVKQQSVEVRCSSFDIDAPYSGGSSLRAEDKPQQAATKAKYVPAPVSEEDSPPF